MKNIVTEEFIQNTIKNVTNNIHVNMADLISVLSTLITQRDKYRNLDAEAAKYVESVICMRTNFTGEEPYVGWKGLGLSLNEALDELDQLREQINTSKTPLNGMSFKPEPTGSNPYAISLPAIDPQL